MNRRLMNRGLVALLLLSGALLAGSGCSHSEEPWITEADRHPPILDASGRVIRYGPIITGDMLPDRDGRNINTPWLINVPEWVNDRLGKYYLYFSSHGDSRYIRMAYADEMTGPWHIYAGGVFRSEQGPSSESNVSAPSVVIDDERRLFILYFNSRVCSDRRPNQTFVATSANGLDFEYVEGPIGSAYSAALPMDGWYYLFLGASGQVVHRSRDGITDFEQGARVLPRRLGDTDPYSRHVAVRQEGETLQVFYTRKRDAPERILMGTIDLTQDWQEWTVQHTIEIMRPEMRYEGAVLPVTPSSRGPARVPEHALRDPAVYEEEGLVWLLYTIAGEQGIALAELLF